MPIYYPETDVNTLKGISEQLVQRVMDVQVLLFKVNPQKMESNIYGQTKKKVFNYYPGIFIKCLVFHNPHELSYDTTYNYKDYTTFKFLISSLQKLNVYPEIGDVIQWDNLFWEITKITQQQLIGNRTDLEWSRICETTVLANSKVNQLKELKLR